MDAGRNPRGTAGRDVGAHRAARYCWQLPAQHRRTQMRRPATPGRVAGTPLLIVLAMAQFMVVLDFTIVNVALPSIQTGLNIGTSTLQWLVSGYAVAFGGFLLLGGRLADM